MLVFFYQKSEINCHIFATSEKNTYRANLFVIKYKQQDIIVINTEIWKMGTFVGSVVRRIVLQCYQLIGSGGQN